MGRIYICILAYDTKRFLSCDRKIVTSCFNRPSLIAILHGNENSCILIKAMHEGWAVDGKQKINFETIPRVVS